MQVGFSLLLRLHVRFSSQRQLVRADLNVQGFLLQSWELCFHDVFVVRVNNINVRYSRRQFIFHGPLESPGRGPTGSWSLRLAPCRLDEYDSMEPLLRQDKGYSHSTP